MIVYSYGCDFIVTISGYMIIWLYVVYGYYMLIVLKQEPFQGNIAQIAVRGTP